ncbi:MAG: response regulator [Desulfobacterales bacterium]
MQGNKQKHVLVVEDEQPLQELYAEVFTRNGYGVDVAENGRIGFRKGVTFDYDIIICDLHLPEWHGVDAIKGILMVKPQCRFVVVSGYTDRKIADELRNIDKVIRLFAKPVDMDELFQCIATA